MSLSHSPGIVTNGLVYGHDMYNRKKSYVGAPTTNELTSFSFGGDGGSQTGMTVGAVAITDPKLTYRGLDTILWTPGNSYNVYMQPSNYTTNTSTVWTFSCFIRREDRKPITALDVYMYYPSSDGAATGTITDIGDGWYRVHRTRTGSAAGISLAGFTGFSPNTRYYLSGPMLEKQASPSYPTAVATSRTASQAILDLTGLNTVTSSNMTYGISDFSFNGTNSALTLPDASRLSFTDNRFTFEFWVYFNALPGSHGIIGKGQGEWEYAIYVPGNSNVYFYAWNIGGAGVYIDSGSVAIAGQWTHYCWAADGINARLYVNGSLTSTTNKDATYTMGNGSNNVTIGAGGDSGGVRYLNGKLPQMRIYNRPLTATEVAQNYKATKGLFGL